jgi:hypothetical protein
VLEKVKVAHVKRQRVAQQRKDKHVLVVRRREGAPLLNVLMNVKHGHWFAMVAMYLEQHGPALVGFGQERLDPGLGRLQFGFVKHPTQQNVRDMFKVFTYGGTARLGHVQKDDKATVLMQIGQMFGMLGWPRGHVNGHVKDGQLGRLFEPSQIPRGRRCVELQQGIVFAQKEDAGHGYHEKHQLVVKASLVHRCYCLLVCLLQQARLLRRKRPRCVLVVPGTSERPALVFGSHSRFKSDKQPSRCYT